MLCYNLIITTCFFCLQLERVQKQIHHSFWPITIEVTFRMGYFKLKFTQPFLKYNPYHFLLLNPFDWYSLNLWKRIWQLCQRIQFFISFPLSFLLQLLAFPLEPSYSTWFFMDGWTTCYLDVAFEKIITSNPFHPFYYISFRTNWQILLILFLAQHYFILNSFCVSRFLHKLKHLYDYQTLRSKHLFE